MMMTAVKAVLRTEEPPSPLANPSCGNHGATPGRRAVAQRAAEIAERRAVFDANNNN